MISAVDSRTSSVAGGAYVGYYNYNVEDGNKTVNYNALQIGLSYAYPIMGGLVLGIGGRYYKYQKDDENYLHSVTFDLGMTYRFSPYIKIGVVGYNLANLDYIETPMSIVSGISVGDDEMFLINFDFVADFSAPKIYDKSGSATYEYHTGIQVTPTDGFSILAGYEINKVLDENFWSLGTEIFVPESRVELTTAYLQSTSKESNKYFSFSLRLYF
jgi:opacity protein-like surface antigen